MKVELIAFTNVVDDLNQPGWDLGGADRVCNLAARTCVSEDMPVWEDEDLRSLKHALDSGHDSILDHVSFTFSIEGISRACSHQLVRHRIGVGISQQSQRYVDMGGFRCVVPASIESEPEMAEEYRHLMNCISSFYADMVKRCIPEEDARYVLPNACCTNLVMTFSGRALKNLLETRLCARSQWEIRELAERMLELVKPVAPVIFENAGPKCVRLGRCPERKGCGRMVG